MMEGLEDVGAAFVADDDPTISGEPGQAPLDHPAVSPKRSELSIPRRAIRGWMARRRSACRHAGSHSPYRHGAWPAVVAVGRRRTDWRHSIDHCRKELAIVAIGRAEPDGERDAVAVHNDVALASWLARSVGFGPVPGPPFGGHARAVHASPAPVDGIGPAQPVEQDAMQPVPDAGGLPLAQPPPARHPRPATHLRGQHLPGDAALQHKQDATQRRPMRQRWPPPFGFGRSGGSSGSITAHRSSDTRSLAISPGTARSYGRSRFCLGALNARRSFAVPRKSGCATDWVPTGHRFRGLSEMQG